MENIDKDIENVKNLLEWSGCETSIDEKTEQSIKNVLSDRETWKKIAEKLAFEILLKTPFGEVSEENIKTLIDEVRKEVEK